MYSVWQWTDEFCDRHSCVSLVRGGSNYAHSPAGYYFPRPSSLATHNTWLMLSESMDRKGTFGFRCVVDAEEPPSCPFQLCGRVNSLSAGTNIDLTTEGTIDWTHYGRTTALDVNAKARNTPEGPTIQVSVLSPTPVLPSRGTAIPGFSTTFSWSDGQAVPIEDGTPTGIYLTQASGGQGFRITVPARPAGLRTTLKLYIGAEFAQGKLLASLGGGETTYSEVFPPEGPTLLPRKGVFSLDLRSTDDWPISITWELGELLPGSESAARVTLLAAALSPTDN